LELLVIVHLPIGCEPKLPIDNVVTLIYN